MVCLAAGPPSVAAPPTAVAPPTLKGLFIITNKSKLQLGNAPLCANTQIFLLDFQTAVYGGHQGIVWLGVTGNGGEGAISLQPSDFYCGRHP